MRGVLHGLQGVPAQRLRLPNPYLGGKPPTSIPVRAKQPGCGLRQHRLARWGCYLPYLVLSDPGWPQLGQWNKEALRTRLGCGMWAELRKARSTQGTEGMGWESGHRQHLPEVFLQQGHHLRWGAGPVLPTEGLRSFFGVFPAPALPTRPSPLPLLWGEAFLLPYFHFPSWHLRAPVALAPSRTGSWSLSMAYVLLHASAPKHLSTYPCPSHAYPAPNHFQAVPRHCTSHPHPSSSLPTSSHATL